MIEVPVAPLERLARAGHALARYDRRPHAVPDVLRRATRLPMRQRAGVRDAHRHVGHDRKRQGVGELIFVQSHQLARRHRRRGEVDLVVPAAAIDSPRRHHTTCAR